MNIPFVPENRNVCRTILEAYFAAGAGVGVAAGCAAAGFGAALPAVAAGCEAAAVCGCAPGLIQQA